MNESKSQIYWHLPKVTIENRRKLNQHRSCLIWLTGLSASGKSTIANELDKYLHNHKIHSYVLDGDNVRHNLNKDLGFSPTDRKENVRRIGEVAKLFVDAGIITIVALISPYLEDRKAVRNLFPPEDFIEVYIKCSIEECERRDPKDLYKKARTRQLTEFTGVSAPYEISENPEIIIETDKNSIETSVLQLVNYLLQHKYV